MKVSHILYKVDNLETAVQKFRADGFEVEYGTRKNPYNAIIYFSEGPYLELFNNANMPKWIKIMLCLFGKKKMVARINHWENAKEGLIAVCLENYKDDFKEEKELLKKCNQGFFETKSKRLDTKNRLLKFRVLFPDELKIPFLMTYFTVDPKPKNFIHPNGVKVIKSISFGTDEKFISLINQLCDDPILKLFEGKGVKDLEYEK